MLYSCISIHLKSHKTEDEIKAFKHISGIKDRRKELDRLRLRGDFILNQKVLEENKGQLILARCPSEKMEYTNKAISHPASSVKGILSDGSYGDSR